MKIVWLLILTTGCLQHVFSQTKREEIYSDFVLYQKRTVMEKDLRERVIGKTFSMPLDSNSEYRYESACGAISQFMFANADVENGFRKMFARYDSLEYDTRHAFLEALYATYPSQYADGIRNILVKETDPKLFSICAAYLFRIDMSTDNSNFIKIKMVEQFPGYDTLSLLTTLMNYLGDHEKYLHHKTPDVVQLFTYQKNARQKIIYSFQRWNRDYPGLAIVQSADGRFVKDADGRLQVFEQLARSGCDLPYFITNGSTPQGIYSIQGTDVAHNNFIGPTPNIQLVMPFESKWEKFFRQRWYPQADSLQLYLQLLPESWRKYQPMLEAWEAGKVGRTEIIAHGTALDPEYFKDKPFYPLTPTLGCLCARELWNPTSGRLLLSEQFNLVSAFQSTTGYKGYLFVIDIDDQQKAVSRQEIEAWVKKYESGK